MKNLVDITKQLGEEISISAGNTLYTETDAPQYLYVLISGVCILSKNAVPLGHITLDTVLSPIPSLGGHLSYKQRAFCETDCVFTRLYLPDAWKSIAFRKIALDYLSQIATENLDKLEQTASPIHYKGNSAQLNAGAFEFPNSEIIFAFCHAELSSLILPDGVTRMGNSLLVAFADFPNSRYANAPDKTFSYKETTFFVPVRVGSTLGLYVPYIYPSSYEAILLGREIYGFPKRLGYSELNYFDATLTVDAETLISLSWQGEGDQSSEGQLVGAMGGLFGVQGQLTSAAFRVGDTLLNLMNVPFYRRISVYNHKLIPDITTKYDEPKFAVDQLTQAIFQVERWHSIEKLNYPHVAQVGRMLQNWHIQVREAYRTKLDMRLSTGRLIRDYLNEKQ